LNRDLSPVWVRFEWTDIGRIMAAVGGANNIILKC
jgi:hypothetical protein